MLWDPCGFTMYSTRQTEVPVPNSNGTVHVHVLRRYMYLSGTSKVPQPYFEVSQWYMYFERVFRSRALAGLKAAIACTIYTQLHVSSCGSEHVHVHCSIHAHVLKLLYFVWANQRHGIRHTVQFSNRAVLYMYMYGRHVMTIQNGREV